MKQKIHRYIYLLGLCSIAFFISISEFITNASIILLSLNYLLEFGYKEKVKKLVNTKTLIWFLLIFLVHLLWLFFSTNLDYALNDLKIKLPFLALPIIIGTSKVLSKETVNKIILIFTIGLFINTLIGILSYLGYLYTIDSTNIRHVSIFVSHIRLSLMICLSIFIILHLIFTGYFKSKLSKIIFFILTLWFIFFLFFIQAFTGIVILSIIGFILLVYYAYKERNKTKKLIYLISLVSLALLVISFLTISILGFYTPQKSKQTFLSYTEKGNKYYHNPSSKLIENGNLIYANICDEEIFEEWKKISATNISDSNSNETISYDALLRYLTSRGLTKDAQGIHSLTSEDIKNIENGRTNYKYSQKNSFRKRIYETIWQLDVYFKNNDPNEKSVSQRIEYLKYGLILFKNNIFLGTSNGDINDEYQSLYKELNSPLSEEYRHRSHNQLLTFYISFGILGGTVCLLAWFMPFFIEISGSRRFNFVVFFLIASVSLLSDDTFETTTGAVFISFFYSLFMWGESKTLSITTQKPQHEQK